MGLSDCDRKGQMQEDFSNPKSFLYNITHQRKVLLNRDGDIQEILTIANVTLRVKCPGLFFTFYLQLLNQALQTLCCIYWYLAHSCRIYSLGMYNQLHVLPCHLKSVSPCELWVYIFIMNAAFSQERERERTNLLYHKA